ncbi:MipA/OmpV family protein [Cognatishimia sp. MH4019]|uniref:MipA/OmpV family protein n=1 Tax=Cognatishimia sp. MH4019 TaxID=2854030 RepID=UPI001CD3E5D8|nr:MipA/OmpV family protein [Cognatishimia sp. MH4019]
MRYAAPLACLLTVSAAGTALAQEGFSFGLGASVSSNPYIGEDETDFGAVPILRYQGDGWRVGTDGAGIDLYRGAPITAEAILLPRFTALSDPDSDELDGIDREITLDGGLSFSYALGESTALSARVLQELTGEHDGREFDLSVSTGLALGAVPLSVTGGMSWKSEGLGSYLYGVEGREATADRSEYDVDASVTPYVSLSSGFPLSQAARLVGSVKVEFLPDEVTDSPIVEDDTVTSGFVGVQLSF